MKLTDHSVSYQPQSKSVRFWKLPTVFERTLARAIAFGRLIIRLLLNGYRPQIRQGRDRDNKIYWYAYYPLSGVSKVLAFEAEIKQWLEFTQ
ncbi:MAG: hypothetical protein QNJ72_28155 [Pleurocapsa sp. MO_226.B13]|nr:hypothetical protein [Pleurocapsa sp. MO_226.B13]